MKRLAPKILLLLFTVVLASLYAVDSARQTGKLIDVQKKARTRVLYYLVNTPVTQDEPYYEVSVQLNNKVYVGEYTPLYGSQRLPQEWVPGAEVQARLAGHRFFLLRAEGTEVAFAIVKHTALKPMP